MRLLPDPLAVIAVKLRLAAQGRLTRAYCVMHRMNRSS
jgi:hypothetical protein